MIRQRTGSHLGIVRTALAAFIITTEVVFLYYLAPAGVEFVVSSAILTLAILLQLKFGIRRGAPTPADIVVFIFNWLFLDLAPKIQLMSVPDALVNTSSVVPEQVLVTNLICALFIATFTLVYSLLRRRSADEVAAPMARDVQPRPLPSVGVFLAVSACVIVVLAAGRGLYADTDAVVVITPKDLILHKFLLFLPPATLLILLHETICSQRKVLFSRTFVLMLLFILVAVTQNPLTEKRNGLGPIYLGLIFIAFEPRLRSLNRRLLLLIASMVLGFPAITVLTHNHSQIFTGVKLGAVLDTIKDLYFSGHYDAWANIYTTVEMVKRHGILWGHQLLGSCLFFMPSSLWHGKPVATGIAIANYLIRNYSMWFTNLSAPLIAEGYLDFGVLGVAIYGAVLALLVNLINRAEVREGKWFLFPFATYLAIFLMFALRGSLMIAFAYGTGAMLAFVMASGFLSIGLRHVGERYFLRESHSRFVMRSSSM